MSFTGDAHVLWSMLRGQPRSGSHAERLAAFYGPQASQYDAFRERLLHGRAEMIGSLTDALMESRGSLDGARVVELGGGTGRNLLFFGPALDALGRVDLVDLCTPLLAEARGRFLDRKQVHVTEADACTWRPDEPVDAVYFSYALTMIPDWRAALDNALAMLKPGGVLGVADFYVSDAKPPAGLVRHDSFTRLFWPRWFAHDGVRPCPDHPQALRERLPAHRLWESMAPVPYLPLLRVPYYRFIGRLPH
ncbi:MAG: class I SAM-dependent methyltransferase [Thiohalocapsa sp.]|uniref:class I SAM-dependent methyltransferase n=1 Tax=Thiohalocapsa sp. TaxID=2497641 RepID=UPI0025FEB7B1|nr:class I SAM-dependent methyltransferase [Thiohalocapsa sp.]MCG6940378.1 class I SAM-dependent methyltransferase [Thiohalocapsa sp.]